MEQINITDSANALVNKLNNNFNEVNQHSSELPKNIQSVFLGSHFVKDGNWVAQKDGICNVANGITYYFQMPNNIVAKVAYSFSGQSSATSNNLFNGDSFTFPEGANTQKLYFAKYSSGTVQNLPVTEAEELLSSEAIIVTYEDTGVIERNTDKDNLFATAKRVVKNAIVSSSDVNIAPILAHISDLHGDIQRAHNFLKYCKFKGVDDCIITGDSTLYSGDGIDYMFDAAADNSMHISFAMGNHEALGVSSSAGVMFSTYLANYAEELKYYKAANTVTDRGYYYYDIADKSLRIIVLDQYDGGVYGGSGKGGRISQGQIDFILSALSSAPQGYGIVIAMHSQEDALTMPNAYSKFISSRANGYASDGFYVDESRPIKQIVDAFIGRTTYSGSYSQTYGGATETVTISADFSEVDSSIEFICYLSGHRHRDFIGYLNNTTHPQLLIQVTSGNAHVVAAVGSALAFSGEDDLPRFGTGATQDAFNIYSIDRSAKTVRIVRIGSSMNYEFRERDYLVASYATIPNS